MYHLFFIVFSLFFFNSTQASEIDSLESEVKKTLPHLFDGSQHFDISRVQDLQKSLQKEPGWANSHAGNAVFFDKLAEFVKNNKTKYQSKDTYLFIKKSLNKTQESEEFSSKNLFATTIAALAGLSKSYQEEEVAFFGPFQFKNILQALNQENDVTKVRDLLQFVQADDQAKLSPEQFNVTTEVFNRYMKKAEKLVPQRIYHPFFDEKAELGLATIIRARHEHTYMLPVTPEAEEGHGMYLSQLSQMFHDYGHSVLDGRRDQKLRAIMAQMIEDKEVSDDVTEIVANQNQYDENHKALYAQFLKEYLNNKDKALLTKRLAAYFLKNHEIPTGSIPVMKDKFSDSIIEETKNAIDYINFPLGAVGDFDPLETSALSVTPDHSDEKILEEFVNVHNSNPQNAQNQISMEMIDKDKSRIAKDPFVVQVEVSMNDGSVQRGFFFTYNIKYKFAQNYNALLKIAGYDIPDLTEAERDNRSKYTKYVRDVREKTTELLNWFANDVKTLIAN